MRFQSTLELIDKTTIICNELSLKEYRNFLKCFVGDEIDSKLIYYNACSLLSNLTNKTILEIEKLSFIDFLLILLHTRIVSIGSNISFNINENDMQLKVDLNLFKVIDTLKSYIHNINYNFYTTQNLKVKLGLPSIKDIFEFESPNNFLLPVFFIKQIYIDNNLISFEDFSIQDREQIVQSLPTKIIIQLNQFTQKIIEQLNQSNLLDSVCSKNFTKVLPVTLNTEIICFIIKLIFNTNLENIYEMLFILSKGVNMSGEFLDSCTPGEFYLFFKKLEELNAKQQNKTENNFYPDELPEQVSESEFDLTS